MITTPPAIKGLTEYETVAFAKMWQQWQAKRVKNQLLDCYYDFHRMFRDLGISIPPQMVNVKAALGWPSKAVQALSRKHVFEGYAIDGQSDPFDIGEILVRNNFDVELPQVINSAYKNSCAFVTVTSGDESIGDPPVVIQPRDANWSTGLWDKRRRQFSAAMTITDTKDDEPSEVILYFAHDIVALRRDRAQWSIDRLGNSTGRVLVEMLSYDPQLSRPFGHSRITREVRYLTDAAIRTLVRTETSAEFFSSPQRYVLGASEAAFQGESRWTAITGRIWNLDINEEGNNPTVGQFPQMSMDPHLSMYRQLAQNFCAATNLPQSSVGLFADNPSSAEAMQAAEYALSDEAEYQWRIFAGPLRRVLEDAVMVRDKLTEPPLESWKTRVNWTPARYVSPQASSDYIVKIVQALPQVAETSVALRRAGFSQGEIDEINAQVRKGQARSQIAALAGAPESAAVTNQESQQTSGQDEAADLKAKFDALGVAVRAGVDPDDAATRLGLAGVRFTGAVPVSLRMPEQDAKGLEEK